MSKREAEKRGRRGERRAAWYLRAKGWRILDHRVKTPHGEVDIIARRGRNLVFVEVKYRSSVIERDRSIHNEVLRRVAAAAEALIPKYSREGDDIRIDAILLAPRRLPRHLENIWQP